MEYQSNQKRNLPNSSETSHFTESNTGHISVKTTSPFLNKGKDSEYSVLEPNHIQSNRNHSAIILNKKPPSSGTSKMLISQILGDSNIEKDVLSNFNTSNTEKGLNLKKKCNYDHHFLSNNVELRYSTPTFNSKSFSMQPGSCSREDTITPSSNSMNEKDVCLLSRGPVYSEKQFAEKTTYCRPSKNQNLEYIKRTVEKNNRLQRLVEKLIDARKKEKQTEAWNNYINELKNKHGYGDSGRNGFVPYSFEEPTSLEYIDDYYYAQNKPTLSNPCKELLHEFYDAYNTVQYDNPYCFTENRSQKFTPQNYRSHLNRSNCYPMSSQGRLMMLNRERNKNRYAYDWRRLPTSRPFHGNTIYVDREPAQRSISNRAQSVKINNEKCPCKSYRVSNVTNTSAQTDEVGLVSCVPSCVPETNDKQMKEISTQDDDMKDVYSRVSENVDRLKKKIQESCYIDTSDLQNTVLHSIESKLDTLVTSINSFIEEVKSKAYTGQNSRSYDCRSVYLKPLNKKTMGLSRSDTIGLVNAENYVCGLIPKPSLPTAERNVPERSCGTNIDKILIEEINSSKKVKEDIESMLSSPVGNCSVQISIEIPTKDGSTEVTQSLSKAVIQLEDKSVSIREIERNTSSGDRNMTIAVNTDPLGLLALFRISTETVKQLLSYMPNIPYHQYLSMINFPQRRESRDYVCNICGAAFMRPSQLSDHIRTHDLGKTRDCCVCRHVLDMQRHRSPGLFRCQHCGQRFTRAYCCELHQEGCAKRLGRRHDVTPSLMLLR